MTIQSRPRRGLAVARTRSLSLLRVVCGLASLGFVFACASEDPLVRARALQEANRFDESLPLLEEMMDVGSDDPEVLYRYGLALSRAGMPSRAIWPLNKAMRTDEWLVPAALVVARNGSRTSNFEEAIAAATTVLEHEPDNEQALMVRAEARTRTRKDSDYELDPRAEPRRTPRADPPDDGAPRARTRRGGGRVPGGARGRLRRGGARESRSLSILCGPGHLRDREA